MTKARLIKPDVSPKPRVTQPATDGQIGDTIRSWVQEFRLAKADQIRSDFQRLERPHKT
jgi:hypothetical protein